MGQAKRRGTLEQRAALAVEEAIETADEIVIVAPIAPRAVVSGIPEFEQQEETL